MRRVAFLASTLVLFAFDARGEPVPDAQLQPVIVEAPPPASAPGEADRAPAAASTIIDAQETAAEGRSTSDLVARAPGAIVHAYGGAGQLTTLSLRGSSSEQCLVMLDGVPVTGALSGTVDLSTFPSGFLDRIEIIRGVVGPLYGPGALGGAVNLVTRAPQPGPPSLEAEIRGGSFDTGELRLSGSSSVGGGSALVAFDALGTNGAFPYRPPDATADVARSNNDAEQVAGLGRYVTPLGAGRTLDVLFQAEHGDRGLAGSIESPSFTDRLIDTRLTASARLTQPLDIGSLELRAFARADDVAASLDQALAIPQLDTLAGAEAQLHARAGHHGLSLVVHAAGEQFTQEGTPAHSRPELAIAGADEWLLANGAVSLLPAIRIDRVDRYSGVSPQLALAVRPVEGLELRGSIGQTFRAPTFDELYLNSGLVAANPDLIPERALGADLGATWQRGPFRASAGGFATEYVNLIEYELYPPFLTKPFNVGTAGIGGLEAELSLRPRQELELSAIYSRQWSADLYDDVRFYEHELPEHPHHRGGGRVAWTGARLTAHAEAYAQSSQFLSRANTAELPGRVDTSLGAAFRPISGQPIWLGVEVQNVLDQQSEDLYGYPLPGRALYALVRLAAPSKEHP